VDQQVTSDPASFDALSSYLILVDWDGLFCSGYLSYFVLVTRSGGLTGFLGLSIGELGEMTGETTTARAKAKADPYGMTNKKGSPKREYPILRGETCEGWGTRSFGWLEFWDSDVCVYFSVEAGVTFESLTRAFSSLCWTLATSAGSASAESEWAYSVIERSHWATASLSLPVFS
jgi:hypothetical protein